MNFCRLLAISSGLFLSSQALCAAEPASLEASILERVTNVTSHPRLFMPSGHEAQVLDKIKADRTLGAAWDAVVHVADITLTEPPVAYEKEGRRLLSKSREALARVLYLGTAFRLTGDQKYVPRVVAEMKAMSQMVDWNPSHFLDTAEMTLAMAVAYDWFYSELSDEQRIEFRNAIETKGLKPYLSSAKPLGWEKGGNNWNQVCHAGMLAGALALAEDNPGRAAEVTRRAVEGLPHAMKVYNPDGNYPEGPGYWNYGTTFNVVAIALLESALGSDFELSTQPGFLKAAEFPLHTMGPTFKPFNFSDCGTGAHFASASVWFASRASKPELLWYEWSLLEQEVAALKGCKSSHQADRMFPLLLLWSKPGQHRVMPSQTSWFARGQNPIAVFRSSWEDSNAMFLAIKAGTPSASHAHMDIGSFVLDVTGERWSLDLGAQNYHGLESRGVDLWNAKQGSERWTIFRYHNRAHSTLLVDDAEQVTTGRAEITEFSSQAGVGRATVDMTKVYNNRLIAAIRHFEFGPGRKVVVEDRLTAGEHASTVRWGMMTRAKLTPDGQGRAWLVQNGKRLRMEVVSPHSVSIRGWSAEKPPREYDEPNPGAQVVGFETTLKPGEAATFKVSLSAEN